MFELYGTGAAAAADHTDRNLVAAFILDNNLCQVTVEDLADSLAEGEIYDGCGDEGVFGFIVDGDGDACQFEIVAVLIERAGSIFDYSENYFWKTHFVSRYKVRADGKRGRHLGFV